MVRVTCVTRALGSIKFDQIGRQLVVAAIGKSPQWYNALAASKFFRSTTAPRTILDTGPEGITVRVITILDNRD